jgi:hypothetical protein
LTKDITCPICDGTLVYWKEYIVTKSQAISKTGVVSNKVKTSKPEEFGCNDMDGFQCTKCGWVFNIHNDVGKYDKYPHLEKWLESHGDEIKV